MKSSKVSQSPEIPSPALPSEHLLQSQAGTTIPGTLNKFAWAVIVSAIVLGVVCRFTNLDYHPIWRDEVATQFYLAAKQPSIDFGQMRTKAEWLQQLNVQSNVTAADVVHNLADRAAEQEPFYYMMANAWSKIVGETPHNLRMLSALIGVSAIGGSFLLAMELFETPLAGGFCAALVALSPFHVHFSQEARPYELWALAVILSSLILLRADRNRTGKNWLLYALASATGVYTHLFSVLVAAAHGLWGLLNKRLCEGLMLSLAVTFACFYPWYSQIAVHGTKSNWLNAPTLTFQSIPAAIAMIVTGTFYDSNATVLPWLQIALTFLLIAGSLITMFLFCSKRQSTFAASILFVPTISLLGYFWWHHSLALFIERYYTPLFVAIPVCVAGALSVCFNRPKLRIASMVTFSGLVIAGAFSSICFLTSPTWHHHAEKTKELAELINQHAHPVVLLDAQPGPALALTGMLRDDAKMMILNSQEAPPNWLSPPYLRAIIYSGATGKFSCEYVEDPLQDTTSAPIIR
ncbi:MAG TPA: glycosyltransferase family 39 protein [Trichormus sp.]